MEPYLATRGQRRLYAETQKEDFQRNSADLESQQSSIFGAFSGADSRCVLMIEMFRILVIFSSYFELRFPLIT